jgi:integrase
MPRKFLMGFESGPKRWRKMYKGERYEVYCSGLNLSEDQCTELGSYQAANDWWNAKRAEIDSTPVVRRPDVEEVIKTLRKKRQVLAGGGEDTSEYDDAIRDAEAATKPLLDPALTFASDEDEIEAVCNASQPEGDGVSLLDPRTSARVEFLSALGIDLSGLDPVALELALGSAAYWEERFAKVKKVPEDRRLGTLLDGWLLLKRKKATATTLVRLQGHKKAFECLMRDDKVVLDADMSVDVLTEQKFEEVFHAIDAEERDEATKDKKWLTFKNFVRYVVSKRLVPMPLNMDADDLSFEVTTKQKPQPVMTDVRDFIGTLPDRLRLFALLAANCGMNNCDIGKLTANQIDFAARTLTRKRVKTVKHKQVPTVTYWLWDETIQLLRQEMTEDANFLLLDAKGEPLYIDKKDGPGGASLYDKIKSSWRDYFGRDGSKKYTLKDFRFIPADLIKAGQYRLYRDVWLGHSPKSVAEKSYSSSEDCTEVCKWLYTQFFPQ